jgi:integrase
MPRHSLKPIQVQNAHIGDTSDGDGLFLRIKPNAASWVFRYTSPSGRRRETGLGSCNRSSVTTAGESLTQAREAAQEARKLLRAGLDPVDEGRARRERARAAEAKERSATKATQATLRRCVRAYHEQHVEPIRTTKHGAQWINSIEQHVPPSLLDAPIDSIRATGLLDALVPILRKVPETGSRVYQRLAAVLDAAVIEGLIAVNPATPIRRELHKRAGRRERGSFAAMPYRDVPGFLTRLRTADGTSARCLEFTILTASRTSEALTAEWSEIDLSARLWTIPAAKMKAREQHSVYLSERAVELLRAQEGQHDRLVFPSTTDAPMSNMALAMCLRRLGFKTVTVHGFRAGFSTWAHELGIAQPGAIEAALAHREQDRVAASYNRAAFLRERAALMGSWGAYCTGQPVTQTDGTLVTDAAVIAFRGARRAA